MNLRFLCDMSTILNCLCQISFANFEFTCMFLLLTCPLPQHSSQTLHLIFIVCGTVVKLRFRLTLLVIRHAISYYVPTLVNWNVFGLTFVVMLDIVQGSTVRFCVDLYCCMRYRQCRTHCICLVLLRTTLF
jgi:hypothetical protein